MTDPVSFIELRRPNIPLGKIPECQKYLEEGSHRRLYTFSPKGYVEMAGVWDNGEMALPGDPKASSRWSTVIPMVARSTS